MTGVERFRAWEVPAWPSGRVPSGGVLEAGSALEIPELDGSSTARLCRTLRAERDDLVERPWEEVVDEVGRAGERFLDPDDPVRREALRWLPSTSGLSPEMATRVLDGMARDWTAERLRRLVAADFPDPRVLDGFAPASEGRRLRVLGPPLAFHLAAGSVPGVGATSLIRSLLVKTPVLLKPGRGDVVLPVLLLRALSETAPGLARAAAVVYWPGADGSSREVEDAALSEADLVVAYGSDDTVAELRARLLPTCRFVSYRNRMSFAVVGARALDPSELQSTARRTAEAVVMFDRRGCVSPHAVFVVGGGDQGTAAFVEALVDALEALDEELPPGEMAAADAAALQQLRGTAELRAAAGEPVQVRSGEASAWTVLLDPESEFGPSPPGRVIRVVPVDGPLDVARRVRPLAAHLQTAGVSGLDEPDLGALAEALARVGVSRVASLDGVAFPPPWWRHDGRGPLRVLVRWAERPEPR